MLYFRVIFRFFLLYVFQFMLIRNGGLMLVLLLFFISNVKFMLHFSNYTFKWLLPLNLVFATNDTCCDL